MKTNNSVCLTDAEKELLYMLITFRASEYNKEYHIGNLEIEPAVAKIKIQDGFIVTKLSYGFYPIQTGFYLICFNNIFNSLVDGKWYDLEKILKK